jgi:branched-chain amino acid transport system ATP-binding protein
MSLEAFDVEVRFGGVTALAGVSVSVDEGQIRGVIGPNGSGKSTLFNCFSGFVKLAAGRVVLDGTEITHEPPHRRIHRGVARTFQTPRFRLTATVEETVACGFFPGTSSGFGTSLFGLPKARREERRIKEQTDDLLDRFRLLEAKDVEIGQLPLGKIRLIEVARAMAMKPRYLLLDEPAAGLSEDEQRLLAAELRSVAAEGVGVVLVEHNFDLVIGVCDEITVLTSGSLLVGGPPTAVASDPRVVEAYLGLEDEVA